MNGRHLFIGSLAIADAVSLQVETDAGLKLRLGGTSDLSTWSPVQRTTSFSGQETLTDTQPASHRGFYRVAAEP